MRRAALALLLAGVAAACAGSAAPAARAAGIDGISDQSLPAWDGAFARSALGAGLRASASSAQRRPDGIAYARYVVQWDAFDPGYGGPGDYPGRFEAWLSDVSTLGLTPVVALTSYDGVHPSSVAAYGAALAALLARARALGHPVGVLEPWNEPNGQGHAAPATAAAYADFAAGLCVAEQGCRLVAGDFEDRAGAAGYAREYARALTFAPQRWGVHPYASVAAREDGPLLALLGALPATVVRPELWITEVAAMECRRGVVLGDASQAQDAAYLVDRLASDPAVAPAHVFYYGLQAGDGRTAQCTAAGGEDGELFRPDATPRPAAAVVFPALVQTLRALAFGPGPGAGAIAGGGGGDTAVAG